MLLTGPQRETIGTFVPHLFHPPDEIKLPVARVVVCDTILLLNIIMIMPASQKRSNCAFRFGLRRLATMPTAKSGFKLILGLSVNHQMRVCVSATKCINLLYSCFAIKRFFCTYNVLLSNFHTFENPFERYNLLPGRSERFENR